MRKLGWVRPLVKFPANYWRPDPPYTSNFPESYRLDCEHLPAFDQGEEPDGAIHAVLSALDIAHNGVIHNLSYHPSADFVRRSLHNEDTRVAGDVEFSITEVIRHIQKYGYVSDSDLPYEPNAIYAPLDDSLVGLARTHTGIQFSNIALSVQIVKLAILSGLPVVVGIVAYASIFDEGDQRSGVIRRGNLDEWPVGGYAVCITGWDDRTQRFRIRVSFGSLWGENGYGWIGYSHVMDQSVSDDHYVFISL